MYIYVISVQNYEISLKYDVTNKNIFFLYICISKFITMKSHIFLVILSALMICQSKTYAQIELSFTAKYQNMYYPLDSIVIENLQNDSKTVLYYPDTIFQTQITSIQNYPQYAHNLFLKQNFPNPYDDNTNFQFFLPENGNVTIEVTNILGQRAIYFQKHHESGLHSYSFKGGKEHIYLLNVQTEKNNASIFMICSNPQSSNNPEIAYIGFTYSQPLFKEQKTNFIYEFGNVLQYSCFITDSQNNVQSEVITDSPLENKMYTFQFENPFRIVILMYHEIVSYEPDNEYQRHVNDFENDLIYLQNEGYQILSIEDLLLINQGQLDLEANGVIITFDDGYNSDYSKAFPLLSQYNMPATFFIVTDWIGTENYMTWSEVWLMSEYRNNANKRLFTIGSHTSSHPFLEQSSQNFPNHQAYLNFLNTELEDSKNWIVDVTGQQNIFLSLPFGDGANNQDIIQTAINNGYKGIRTSLWNSFSIQEMNLFVLPSLPILTESSINSIETYF
jgi:peptidoglycan/xylan/chitin deacetylase (PgdA/CDA1 family)